jgi:hypothetical protein
LNERFVIEAQELEKKYKENVMIMDPEGKAGFCRVETVDVEAMGNMLDDYH